jgi:hypothetical protein
LYAEKHTESRRFAQPLYPQVVPQNPLKIEGNRFVDKVFEKLENSNS